MEQCSICLDNIDSTGPTLACGHRFHAACLARLAGANGTTPTRRGALTKSKANGKWANYKTFPGREFDDLDEYRAAKKQHTARRKEYSAQARDHKKGT